MKFDLKQLSLTSGIFTVILVLLWCGWIYLRPDAILHRDLLLEELPGATWPLSFGYWLFALIGGFICGALSGLLFGVIFNCCGGKK